jgi:hypothetical protein
MGNIKNYNFNKLDLKLSNSDYWDFYLSTDGTSVTNYPVSIGDCLIALFDFNNSNIYDSGDFNTKTISSLISWDGAINTGYTFNTIGLTGIDNGLVTFDKPLGDTSNLALLSALTGSTLIIPANDKRLHLSKVSGTTNNFIYPIDLYVDGSGNYGQFLGGFYQGYYKIDNSTYNVLPERINKGWVAEFWLKKDRVAPSPYTENTLNDIYPNNKGFFFYWGTRAENKFWNLFEGADTGCTSACTVDYGCTDALSSWCTIPKETDILINDNGDILTLYPNRQDKQIITNNFLIYGRARSGSTMCSSCGGGYSGLGNKTVCNYDGEPIVVKSPKTVITNDTNPFLIYGRARSGSTMCSSCGSGYSGLGDETVCSFSGDSKSIQFDNLDYNVDIYDNAFGLRIKNDGSIGYRLLTITGSCSGNTTVTGYTIEEKYSEPDLIPDNLWSSVIVRFTTNELTDCELTQKPIRKGKLMFYINGKLKFVVNDFNEFIGKRLEEHATKQVGVPFNISLGGGSQGLIETQTFDGRDTEDLNLPIQENFAGSFIGGISKFKFNICDLNFVDIQNIYNTEAPRYVTNLFSYLSQEDGFLILQEDEFKIILE